MRNERSSNDNEIAFYDRCSNENLLLVDFQEFGFFKFLL